MADIELVIKIPESRYRLLQKQARTNLGRENMDEFAEAVLNGIPLPKGHGRLIDADFTLEQYDSYCKANCQYSEKQREFMCRACSTGDAIEMIEDAPTIIEADTESEG